MKKEAFSIRGRARALLLKLHFATFSHWERSFSASVALHSFNLLSCTKHSIRVLRSSELVILCIEPLIWLALQKSSKTWKSVFCIANNISWERSIFHILELYFINSIKQLSLTEKEAFQHPWPCISSFASCSKHSISVLRSSKLVILCIEALIWLALQKSSNTWKSVFCIANNISWERSIFHVLEFYS